MQPHSVQTAQEVEYFLSSLLADMMAETQRGRQTIPMAALCKRLGVRMSTLQRHLTSLAEHGVVTVHCDDGGRWTTELTAYGMGLFDQLAA
ncbi:MAG TPA: helix-turn-helix domain-containing protein [Methylovorus sp.]|nr:helix-turn-helix domain-containing protein [Methylovorus sp.]